MTTTTNKNIFKGVQVTFNEEMIDNSEYNKQFDREGFRQHMLPYLESSVARFERVIEGLGGYKYEREFTIQKDGTVTMYLNFNGGSTSWLKDRLARQIASNQLSSVVYGSMKSDATFKPSKNQ